MDGEIVVTGTHADLDCRLSVRGGSVAEYMPVIFAPTLVAARKINKALEAYGIPTLVEYDQQDVLGLGVLMRRVPVLVPEEMQDEASEIVARLEKQPIAGFDEEDDDSFEDDDFLDDEDMDEDDFGDDDLYEDEDVEDDDY